MPKTERQLAWDEFSKYKRIKDCLETTGFAFLGVCITCNRQHHISYLQSGHLISGRRNSVLFSEKFVNAQCTYCNMTRRGESKKYEKVMREKYGDRFVDKWKPKLKHMNIQDKNINWAARRERYKRKYKQIMRKHGFKTWTELLGA